MMPSMKPMNSTPVLQAQEESFNRDFETIKTPLPSDILCGKNKICIKHEGSKNFRRIIESYTLQYQQASSRQAKMDITKEIFDRLQTHRFLKYNEDTDMWETLHPLAVRDKIGHALRFSNRKGSSAIRKQVRRSTSDISSLSSASFVGSAADAVSSMSMSMSDSGVRRSSANSISMCLSQGNAALRHSTGNLPQFSEFSLLEQMASGNFGCNNNNNSTFSSNNHCNSNTHNLHAEFQLMQPALPPLGPSFNNTQWNCSSSFTKPVPQTSTSKNFFGSQVRSNEGDLSWMLQMPLLELDTTEGTAVRANHQASI
ncbi:expressed unknown protein [Seminavis robusta]|uniref:DUF6824 domain-containing protein n=1 Tax=Seminavis robusta TaxID=568900 RepID=A0A9N8E5J0_9STRA|nr:expressed unknown protein [Seminavis robusta]|eukprot:Sro684_g186690.1 n/a (313) ;mRNA; r:2290-3314